MTSKLVDYFARLAGRERSKHQTRAHAIENPPGTKLAKQFAKLAKKPRGY